MGWKQNNGRGGESKLGVYDSAGVRAKSPLLIIQNTAVSRSFCGFPLPLKRTSVCMNYTVRYSLCRCSLSQEKDVKLS